MLKRPPEHLMADPSVNLILLGYTAPCQPILPQYCMSGGEQGRVGRSDNRSRNGIEQTGRMTCKGYVDWTGCASG